MAKYIYRELETREGERTYQHKGVEVLEDDTNVEEYLNDMVLNFWGEGDIIDDEVWFFGEIIVSLNDWQEISKEEYDILNKYI